MCFVTCETVFFRVTDVFYCQEGMPGIRRPGRPLGASASAASESRHAEDRRPIFQRPPAQDAQNRRNNKITNLTPGHLAIFVNP
ncbi:hypothetical protein JYU34_018909 [Plutella xylostella]|uniref:Uncharacterized protein n=1 Tax=Plutella xylostella TaxID=51655 RepID=A0ABQ7PZ24_PLUXY|nr:hypothetical protein JYU34_018909 [Plutella xylostella]